MKRRLLIATMIVTLSGSVLFTSCIGSFGLTNKVLSWNKSIGNKFVNELVFIAFWIIPVYELSALADILVINSIEFWSGDNIVAGLEKEIDGEKGKYLVKTLDNGYEITNPNGEIVDLMYNAENKTWSAVTGDETIEIITLENESKAIIHMANGEKREVSLTQEGIAEFRQTVFEDAFFAAK